jgi:hypothetical protein
MTSATNSKNQMCPELKDWLECKDFILAMQGVDLGTLPVNTSSLRHYDQAINSVFKLYANSKIEKELKKIVKPWHEACDYALPMVVEIKKQILSGMAQLKKTPLAYKRDVLCHMHTVPTSISAAYLGVTEDDLNALKRHSRFGEHFHGGHCYSMEELNLMARNMHWLGERAAYAADHDHQIPYVGPDALDQVVLVDEDLACAYTDMKPEVLTVQIPHSTLARRRYRLADLEKVRITKLSDKA